MVEVEFKGPCDPHQGSDLRIVLCVFNFADVAAGKLRLVRQFFLAETGSQTGILDADRNTFKQLFFVTLVVAGSPGHLASACRENHSRVKYYNMRIIILKMYVPLS